MDLLTHIAAGAAVGTTVAVCMNGGVAKKAAVLCAGATGGFVPDIDAISLWSKFDATFGRLFNLSHTGRDIYSAKFWYSHHAFMHSLAACLLFAALFLVVMYLVRSRVGGMSWTSFRDVVKRNGLLVVAFISGYILHLICDMPTPASSWGGVNLLFPLQPYIGGWGNIWWWNNYDIFLIISGVIVVNVLMLSFSKVIKRRFRRYLSGALLTVATVAVAIQISNRGVDFNSGTYQQNETRSKEIQKKILGKKLYEKMEKLDSVIPLYF